jgi:hypothetical protein
MMKMSVELLKHGGNAVDEDVSLTIHHCDEWMASVLVIERSRRRVSLVHQTMTTLNLNAEKGRDGRGRFSIGRRPSPFGLLIMT